MVSGMQTRKVSKVRTIESFRRWKDCNRCKLKVECCAFSWLELRLGGESASGIKTRKISPMSTPIEPRSTGAQGEKDSISLEAMAGPAEAPRKAANSMKRKLTFFLPGPPHPIE